jgi:hypothetical protein
MPVDPANATELKYTAAEICAEVLEGTLRYPSETGGPTSRKLERAS